MQDKFPDLYGLMRHSGRILHCLQDFGNGQGHILHILTKNGCEPQQKLLDILGIQPGSLSEILSKLEKKGYITKEKDPEDGRKTIILLTKEGEDSIELRNYQEHNNKLFDVLSDEEQDELRRLLIKLLDSWTDFGRKKI